MNSPIIEAEYVVVEDPADIDRGLAIAYCAMCIQWMQKGLAASNPKGQGKSVAKAISGLADAFNDVIRSYEAELKEARNK